MRKMEREIAAMCQTEGFELRCIEHGRRHLRLHFAAGFVTTASTPSDRRNFLNLRATVRRFHSL